MILGPTYGSTGSSKLSYPGISFDLSSTSGGREDPVESITISPRSNEPALLGPISSVIIQVHLSSTPYYRSSRLSESQPNQGVTIYRPDPLEIIIGETTAQDLLLDLGAPPRKYWKEDDRVARMWGSSESTEDDKGGCGSEESMLVSHVAADVLRFLELLSIWDGLPHLPIWTRHKDRPSFQHRKFLSLWTYPTALQIER